MKDLDKLTKIQIAEAIANIKTAKNLDKVLTKDENELEKFIRALNPAGTNMEWKDFVESLDIYDPEYDRIMRNKTNGHRGFSSLHGCG